MRGKLFEIKLDNNIVNELYELILNNLIVCGKDIFGNKTTSTKFVKISSSALKIFQHRQKHSYCSSALVSIEQWGFFSVSHLL